MTRWKAALIHLAISAALVAVIALGMIFVWFGWELFPLMGGLRLVAILALCDIVIGPMLTLLVYKPGKPSLKFDLTVIALLQVAFLAYGLHIMAQSRPVFLVAVLDRFELVFANELADADLAKGPRPEFRRRSWTGPLTVGGLLATDAKEYLDLAMSGLAGKDVQLLPERYTDYVAVAEGVKGNAKDIASLKQQSLPAAVVELDRAVAASGHEESALVFVPIVSRRGRATMLLERATGAIVGPVAVEPWPDLAGITAPQGQ